MDGNDVGIRSHATDPRGFYERTRNPVGKRCVVYGGGLSVPLALVCLDDEASLVVSNSENMGDGTDATVDRRNVLIADVDKQPALVCLQEGLDIDRKRGGKLR